MSKSEYSSETGEFREKPKDEFTKETLMCERVPIMMEMDEREYQYTKSRLDKTKKLRRSILIYVVLLLLWFSLAWLYLYILFGSFSNFGDWDQETIIVSHVVSFFLFVITSVSYNMAMYFEEIKLESNIDQYERLFIQKNVDENIYESSLKMSYKYLDQYYLQTRQQAGKGFLITLSVAVGGAIVISVGIIAMFLGVTEPAYLTTGCGVITEFIASIFFYLYNKTVQSMGDYHNKLVLSQNVAIALKISESIDGPEKDSVKSEMIKELLKDVNQHINENKPKA